MSLERFFNPESVAIVGASREPGKVGYEILTNMIDAGYEGKIFPVNPKADKIGRLKCYGDLEAIGEVPDLVIIVVPAKIVPAIMNQCAAIRVKAVIIITASFKEVGEQGRRLEQKVVQIAKQAGIRVIGPNCLGVIATTNKLNASFGGDLPRTGTIGYLSQSGALLAAILDMANAGGIGFSKLVSIGNKADVNELDVIEALGQDPDTKVIAGYLESVTNGGVFVRQAERISQTKPILLMKSGSTGAGAQGGFEPYRQFGGQRDRLRVCFRAGGNHQVRLDKGAI